MVKALFFNSQPSFDHHHFISNQMLSINHLFTKMQKKKISFKLIKVQVQQKSLNTSDEQEY